MIYQTILRGISIAQQPKAWHNCATTHVSLPLRRKMAYFYAAELLKKSAGITFDFNGVIINDEPIIKQADTTLLVKYGFQVKAEEYERIFVGISDQEAFPAFFKEQHAVLPVPLEQLISEKLEIYFQLTKQESIDKLFFPGTKELIQALTSPPFKKSLAIASSSPCLQIRKGLELLGVEKIFSGKIIDRGQVNRGKPSPDLYEKSLIAHEKKNNFIYTAIEDTPSGVKAAKAAGMFCIAILNTCKYEDLYQSGADVIIENMQGLLKFFVPPK